MSKQQKKHDMEGEFKTNILTGDNAIGIAKETIANIFSIMLGFDKKGVENSTKLLKILLFEEGSFDQQELKEKIDKDNGNISISTISRALQHLGDMDLLNKQPVKGKRTRKYIFKWKGKESINKNETFANSLIQITKARFEPIQKMFDNIQLLNKYWNTYDAKVRKSKNGEEITVVLINILAVLKTNLMMEEKMAEFYQSIFKENLKRYKNEFG